MFLPAKRAGAINIRFDQHKLARWFAALATAGALTAFAASPDVVDHAFSFNTRYDDQDAEVLDYRYGKSRLPVRAPEQAVREGKAFRSTNVNGPMLRGDFLYVKWRSLSTGREYEDTVDLRQRLPDDIANHRIHFIVKGAQLYVYLISPRRRPPDAPADGPRMYRNLESRLIYPDPPQPELPASKGSP